MTGLFAQPVEPAAPERSSLSETRNPLLALPAAQALMRLPREQREALAALLSDLRSQAREKEAESYSKRKGPMTAYWMAVATYAKHTAAVLRRKA